MLNRKLFCASALIVVVLLQAVGNSDPLTVEPGREPYTSEKTGHFVVYLDGSFKIKINPCEIKNHDSVVSAPSSLVLNDNGKLVVWGSKDKLYSPYYENKFDPR